MKAEQLKASVLNMAFQGKLTEQLDSDSSVDELLEKIKAKKLIKEGKLKKKKVLAPVTDEDIPFDIPENWKWFLLGEIIEYGKVTHVDPSEISAETWVLDLEDIEKGTGRLINRKLGTSTTSNKAKFAKGEVLYSKLRPYLNKVLIADMAGVCTTEIVPINVEKSKVPLKAEYLKIYLMSPYFLTYANQVSYGVKMPRLGTKEAKVALIPIPPIEEQQRIVDKLNELLPLADEYGKYEQELSALNLAFPDKAKQSILQEAIQGKLVPQLTEEGVVEQIGATPKEVPFTIPESWKWCHMEGITHRIHYGFTASATNTGNAKLLRITDIQDGCVNWETVPFCEVPEKKLASSKLKENDVVIARTGGTIGKSFLLTGVSDVAVFASYLIRLIPNVEVVDPRYLMVYLNSPEYWKQLKEMSRGTGQPNVNAKSLSTLLVPLPSLAEQKRIVTKVEGLLKQVDALSAQ